MLLPAAKPRFFPLSSKRISGCEALIRATESFVEPLSTTTIFTFAYLHCFNASRHSIVSRHPFQFRMMQVTGGASFGVRIDSHLSSGIGDEQSGERVIVTVMSA